MPNEETAVDESTGYDVIVTRKWQGGWTRTPIAGPFKEMFEAQYEAKRLKEASPISQGFQVDFSVEPHHVCAACYNPEDIDLEHSCTAYLRSLLKRV